MSTLRRGAMAVLVGALMIAVAPPAARAQGRFVIMDEPDGSAVGVALVISAGTAWELRPELGLSYLAARSVVEEVRPALAALGARLTAGCDRAGTRITLALPANVWEEGAALLLEAVFERPPSAGAIERARRAIIRELQLPEGSDAAEIRNALARVDRGAADRWARPVCGTTETIGAISAGSVRRLVQTRFTPYRTVAAVVGPVGDTRPRALLGRYLPESELPLLLPAPARVDSAADRIARVARNTITAWIGISFEFGADTDLEAIRFLGFMIEERVAPAPIRPEIYDATVEVAQHGGGGSLVVYLVTAPAQAEAWVDKVRTLVTDAGAKELPEPVFEALRRRYTGRRLLGLEAPEARAEDAALQLFYEKRFTSPLRKVEALTPASLRQAATMLAPPTTVLLGPR